MSNTTSPWVSRAHRRVEASAIETGDDVFMHGAVRSTRFHGRKIWVTFADGATHPYDPDESVVLNA